MQKATDHYHRRGLSGYTTPPVGGLFSFVKRTVSDTVDYVGDKAGDAVSWTSDVVESGADLVGDAYSWSAKNYDTVSNIVKASGMVIVGVYTGNPSMVIAGISSAKDEAGNVSKWLESGAKNGQPAPLTPNLGMVLSSANSEVVNQVLERRGYGFKVSKSGEPKTTVVTPDQINAVLPQSKESAKLILELNGYKESSGSFLWLAALLPFLG